MLDRLMSIFSTTPAPEAVVFPKFAVPMPEAGPEAYILMDMAALEELQRQMGNDYWNLMALGFSGCSTLVISRALAFCLRGAEPDGAPWGLSLQDLGRRLFDAQLRVQKGITLAEAEYAIAEAKYLEEEANAAEATE